MPVEISETLAEILPASKRRDTLDLYLADGTVLRLSRGKVIRLITGSPVEYLNYIRSVSELKRSLELAIDRLTITAQNINSELGFNLADDLRLLDYAYAEYGRVYESIRDGELIEDITMIFRGVLANAEATETRVEYEIIVDYDSMGAIVATRTCGYRCPFTYKDGVDCTSESELPDCKKTRAQCKERGKEEEFGGCEPFEQTISTPPSGDGSGIGTGSGGGFDPGYNPGSDPYGYGRDLYLY